VKGDNATLRIHLDRAEAFSVFRRGQPDSGRCVVSLMKVRHPRQVEAAKSVAVQYRKRGWAD